ncbi:MAG: shikimate kinase [Verrucomicrobia bacterium]|nr:shikimate kinase [Verrucomicrobiota bacterium]
MNLSLIGFMGTGKSSVGRFAADQLGFTFLDTDEMIEERTGKSISQIFSQNGEPVFRALEKDLLNELATREHLMISTGGGLAADAENLASLKSHSLVVCLWASPESIWDRVKGQAHRPLLQGPDPLAKIRELLSRREPFYRQADVLVNTEQRSIKEVAQHVVHQLQFARSR